MQDADFILAGNEERKFLQKISPCLTELVLDSHRHKYFQRRPTLGFLLSSVAEAQRVSSDLRSEKFLTAPEFDEAPEADGSRLA